MLTQEINLLKGIHPGIVLERKLRERNLSKGPFALSLNEYPQTLSAITKGKRGMNTNLAIKLESALGLSEGFFMILQVYYDIKEKKRELQETSRPDLSKLRKGLFWDTDFSKIDWHRQSKAVIQRIFERGNDSEKAEITQFYGQPRVNGILQELNTTNAR